MQYSLCIACLFSLCVCFSQELTTKNGIVYGKAPTWEGKVLDLRLDLIYPTKGKKLPLIVNLHGGGFLDGSKETDSGFCRRLANRNFVVANVEYRQGFDRSPDKFLLTITQAIYRAQQDAAAAIRYLVHDESDSPIDTSLIFISGGSAGGVASLFLAYVTQDEWNATAAHLISGLNAIDNSGNNLINKFRIRGVINLWGGINDTSFISRQEMHNTPVLLFHSVNDQVIPYERASHPQALEQNLHGSFDIAQRFRNNNACYRLCSVNGAKHGYGFSQNFVIQNIVDFVKNVSNGRCKSREIENKNAEINLGFGDYVDDWDKYQSKWTELMKMSYKGDTLGIKILLEQGKDINTENEDGWTALKVAVKRGDVKTAKYLLQHKADPNLADREGLNSLMEACLHNNYEIAEMLLENEANPNLTNIYGWTALMGATTNGDIKLMKLLLKYKADINAKRRTDGMTPLLLAKFIQDDEKVKFLTSNGAR